MHRLLSDYGTNTTVSTVQNFILVLLCCIIFNRCYCTKINFTLIKKITLFCSVASSKEFAKKTNLYSKLIYKLITKINYLVLSTLHSWKFVMANF